jgi:hypothetical protein
MSEGDLSAAFDEFRWWTLWEFHGDWPLREPYLDAPNYFTDITEDERARLAGRLLRELHREGWATFVHRDDSGKEFPLSDSEVEEAIALVPRWPVAPEIEDVWLLQTEKARVWQENEHRERFGAG